MPKVTIYTTPSCVYCKLAKQFFQDNKVEYEEKNVVTDLAAREAMVQKSGQMGVPVIEAGDAVIVGFDEMALRDVLKL